MQHFSGLKFKYQFIPKGESYCVKGLIMLLYVFKPLSSGYNPTLSGAGMQYFVL
jgi:hypothetical protein